MASKYPNILGWFNISANEFLPTIRKTHLELPVVAAMHDLATGVTSWLN